MGLILELEELIEEEGAKPADHKNLIRLLDQSA
jgi:hypothetical protein